MCRKLGKTIRLNNLHFLLLLRQENIVFLQIEINIMSIKYLLSIVLLACTSFHPKSILQKIPEKVINPDERFKQSLIFVKSNYGIYTQELLGDEAKAKDISGLKVSYVIYYYFGLLDSERAALAKKDFANLAKYNIRVILMPGANSTDTDMVASVSSLFKDVKNLIGWYCFDEPSFHKEISIEKQDRVINAMKKVKNIPCFIAENASFWPLNKLSANYDGIFLSTYAQTANKSKKVVSDQDILNTYGAIAQFSSLYSRDKLIPIYETFNYKNVSKQMSPEDIYMSCISKKKFYGKNCGAFFIYSAAISSEKDLNDAANDRRLYSLVNKVIDFEPDIKPFLSFGYLYVPGHHFTTGYSKTARDNAMRLLSSPKSTSTIGDYHKLESGIFIAQDKYVVIDFGAIVRSVRLDGYVSARSGYNRPLNFTLNKYASNELNNKKLALLKTVHVVTNSKNGNARFTSILLNINSRFLILKGSSDNKRDNPYFQAMGYVAIPK